MAWASGQGAAVEVASLTDLAQPSVSLEHDAGKVTALALGCAVVGKELASLSKRLQEARGEGLTANVECSLPSFLPQAAATLPALPTAPSLY